MDARPASRAERKKEDTQNRIISVAVELFNQRGLEAVTMEQIAETVDIAKGTLYNYFPSKEAIIHAFLQRTFRERNPERLARLRELPDTRARMVQAFSLLIEGIQRQKDIFEAFMVYRMRQVISFRPAEEERSGLHLLIREIVSLGQQSGDLRTDLPEGMLEDLFEFALIEAVKPFYLNPETFDMCTEIERSVDLFLRGAGS